MSTGLDETLIGSSNRRGMPDAVLKTRSTSDRTTNGSHLASEEAAQKRSGCSEQLSVYPELLLLLTFWPSNWVALKMTKVHFMREITATILFFSRACAQSPANSELPCWVVCLACGVQQRLITPRRTLRACKYDQSRANIWKLNCVASSACVIIDNLDQSSKSHTACSRCLCVSDHLDVLQARSCFIAEFIRAQA